MVRVTAKKNLNIGRIVAKIVGTVLGLYVGGTLMVEVGNVMNGTQSPFYRGLTLIGWTVGSTRTNGTTFTACGGDTYLPTLVASPSASCITSTSGSGILAVVGIVGIASIVMEFVQVSW